MPVRGEIIARKLKNCSFYFDRGACFRYPLRISRVLSQTPVSQQLHYKQVKSGHGKDSEGQQAAGGGMRLAALARGGEGRASLSGGEIRSVRDWELLEKKQAAASDIHGTFQKQMSIVPWFRLFPEAKAHLQRQRVSIIGLGWLYHPVVLLESRSRPKPC